MFIIYILLYFIINIVKSADNETFPCLLSSDVIDLVEYLKTDAILQIKYGTSLPPNTILPNCTFDDNEIPFFYPKDVNEIIMYYNRLKEIGSLNSSLDDMMEFIRLLKYEPGNVGDQMNITCRLILSSFGAVTYLDYYFTDLITKLCNNVYKLGPKNVPIVDYGPMIDARRNSSSVGNSLRRLITHRTNFNKTQWQNTNRKAINLFLNTTIVRATVFAYRVVTYKSVPSFGSYYAKRITEGHTKYELPSFGILKSNPYYNLTTSIVKAFLPRNISFKESPRYNNDIYNAERLSIDNTGETNEWLNTTTLDVMNFFIFFDPSAWDPAICPVDLRAGRNVMDLILIGCYISRAIHTIDRIRHNRIADLFGLYIPKNDSEQMIPIGEVIDPIKDSSLGFVRYLYLPRGIRPQDRAMIFQLNYCQSLSFKYVFDVLFALVKIPLSIYLQPYFCKNPSLQQAFGWLVLNASACRMQDTFLPYQDTCYFSIVKFVVPLMGFFGGVFLLVFVYYFLQTFIIRIKVLLVSIRLDYVGASVEDRELEDRELENFDEENNVVPYVEFDDDSNQYEERLI